MIKSKSQFKKRWVGLTNSKKAFTLAEVLVALTLLGVISSIMIPTTIHNIERRKISTGVAKSYSILTNAIDVSQVVNGDVNGWVFPREDSWGRHTNAQAFAERYLTPYLDIAYVCQNNNNGNRCFAGSNNQWFSANGFSVCNYQARDAYMFRLRNGMSMAVLNRGTQMYNYVKVVVDIDGPDKGGSIMGRDVFYYSIGTFYPSGNGRAACQNPQRRRDALSPGVPHHCGTTGWFLTREQLRNNPNDWFALYRADNSGCGGQDCGASAGCEASVHIIKNNFQIPDYYPLNRMARKCVENNCSRR